MIKLVHMLVIDIYEKKPYPVVRHVFMGANRKEALLYFKAHLKTDVFLRDCVEKNQWEDVSCRVKQRWETRKW